MVDYLSLTINFSPDKIKLLTSNKIDYWNYIKEQGDKNDITQELPYIRGFLYCFTLTNKNIDKIIYFISKYLKERKYMFTWNNKDYRKFVIKIFNICKGIDQVIVYDI